MDESGAWVGSTGGAFMAAQPDTPPRRLLSPSMHASGVQHRVPLLGDRLRRAALLGEASSAKAKPAKSAIREAVKHVAERLGNTPTVCRSSCAQRTRRWAVLGSNQ